MKLQNKDLIQSYILTTARYNFSAYEKRILYRIIEVLQAQTKGLKLNYKYSIQESILNDRDFTLPVSCFLKDEKDKNYDEVRKALRALNKKTIEYEDDTMWELFNLIERPKFNKYESYVKIRLAPEIFQAFLDFSKGYRKYELEVTFKFDSVYSMRIYELVSGKTEPIIYEIDELKKMFGIEEKYKKRSSDFVKYVIKPAQKELTKTAPYSFQFETIKTGRAFTHIKFKPFYIPKNRDSKLEQQDLSKKTSLRWDLTAETIRYLKDTFSFTDKGLKNNRTILKEAVSNEEFKDWCSEINGMVRKFEINNPAGFFISEIKKRIGRNE